MSIKHTSANGLAGNGSLFHFQVNALSVAAVSGTVTLVAAQYESPIITVTGAMSGATTLELPNKLGGQFVINNESTGAILSVKVVGGSAIPLPSGLSLITVGTTLVVSGNQKTKLTLALSDANTTLTAAQVLATNFFDCTGTHTAGRDLVFPAVYCGQVIIRNATGQTLSVKLGATTITQTTGTTKIYFVTPTTLEAIT